MVKREIIIGEILIMVKEDHLMIKTEILDREIGISIQEMAILVRIDRMSKILTNRETCKGRTQGSEPDHSKMAQVSKDK